MKNDNDKWLESLRESLDGFEVEPRPGIWDSIERDAAVARRRPTLTVVWRAVAVAACLALVVGAYFLMSNPDNGNVAPRVSPVITKTETSATPASAGIVTPAELIADSHDQTPRPRAEAVMAITDDAPLVSIDEEPVCTVAPADSVEDRPRAPTRGLPVPTGEPPTHRRQSGLTTATAAGTLLLPPTMRSVRAAVRRRVDSLRYTISLPTAIYFRSGRRLSTPLISKRLPTTSTRLQQPTTLFRFLCHTRLRSAICLPTTGA